MTSLREGEVRGNVSQEAMEKSVCMCIEVGVGCEGYSEPRSLLAPPTPGGMTVYALPCLLSPKAFDLEEKESLALAVP